MGTKLKKKQGATSFYMIIVCALLFGVIAAGFITLMVNEMSKSSENNLSQSAYDSAIVGIEDTKILLKKYNDAKLKENKSDEENKIIDAIENAEPNEENGSTRQCISFKDLSGYAFDVDGNVLIQEVTDNKEITVQAYTCVKINFHPKDYLATLSSENPIRLIPLQAEGKNDNIKSIRISWYSYDNLAGQNTNYYNTVGKKEIIEFSDDASNPPVLIASVYQAGDTFKLDDFSSTKDNNTNRGTLWLVPTSKKDPDEIKNLGQNYNNVGDQENSYYKHWGSFTANDNKISEQNRTTTLNQKALLDSNNHTKDVVHNGFPVSCATNDEIEAHSELNYLCSVEIELPNPYGDSRSNSRGTFLLALSLPYSQPMTDIRVEMTDDNSHWDNSGNYIAKEFDNVQIVIDSTGRANDVYQRVESRVESFNSDFPFPDYTLTVGNKDGDALLKDFVTTSKNLSGCWYTTLNPNNSEPDHYHISYNCANN